MKKYVKLLCVMCALLLVGCGKEKDDEVYPVYTVGGSKVNIYYTDGEDVVCDIHQYQLKQPDSVAASVEELMGILSEHLAHGLSYHTYMFDENNNLNLEFVAEKGELSKEDELLTKASVAKTLFQLAGMGSIQITFTDSNGETLSRDIYNSDSFYFYGYDSNMGLDTKKYNLYYANDDGATLKRKWIFCNPEPYESPEAFIIDALKEAKMIPAGTEIKELSVEGGVCYIKLSGEFANQVGNVKGELVVYSVVNSLTSLDKIDKIMLTVEGNSSGMYRGIVDISKPMTFNEEIVEERK